MDIVLLFFMLYAAIGLAVSIVIHLMGYAGIAAGDQIFFVALHVGIFPLWLMVAYVASKLTSGIVPPSAWNFGWNRDYWDALLAGCPSWLKYMAWGFFIYAIISFVFFFATASTGKRPGGLSSAEWRGFSGHWMLFYCMGLAILTTAYQRGFDNLQRYCLNGHLVSFKDNFCGVCGAKVNKR